MTDPSAAKNNEIEYMNHANEVISEQDMEALGANSEQDFDMNQFIRHQLYIGWILGIVNDKDIEGIHHGGGNKIEITVAERRQPITVIVPYPPESWTP